MARLRAHAGLAALLGTDESGAVPIYAAGPAAGRVAPCVVHTLEGSPDAMLDRAGRWRMELTLEAWGGSPGVNDGVVEAADEVFEDGRFECTDWSVKVIRRTGERTRWTDDGRTEIRRTTWALVVDRR